MTSFCFSDRPGDSRRILTRFLQLFVGGKRGEKFPEFVTGKGREFGGDFPFFEKEVGNKPGIQPDFCYTNRAEIRASRDTFAHTNYEKFSEMPIRKAETGHFVTESGNKKIVRIEFMKKTAISTYVVYT